MRWFIVFLLIANVVLFFWIQQQLQPQPATASLPPPEVGRLRLLSELAPDTAVQRDQPLDGAARDMVPAVIAEQQPDDVVPEPALGAAPDTSMATSEAAQEPHSAEPPPDLRAFEQVAAPLPLGEDSIPDRSIPVETDGLVDNGPAETALEVVVTALPPASEPVCARVGPLEPKDADNLVAKLPPHLELLSDVSEEYAQVAGYYVLIPALPSRADGLRKLQQLEEAGIKDIWLFRDGDLRNAISLGLYRNEDGARQHAEKVAKKGFASEVRERTLIKERRWLQLKDAVGDGVAGGLPLPSGAGVTRQACP